MNHITVAGILGRDAEIRKMPDGTPVAGFSIADSQGKDKPTIWWNCQIFGKRADALNQYLVKGSSVTVSGNIIDREWTDKDGQKRKSMDIRVNDIALQGGRKESAAPRSAPGSTGSGFDDMEDSIPF